MSKHTKEPWEIEQAEDSDYIHVGPIDERGIMPFVICSLHDESDAQRIVSCVNACAGIDQDALDGGWTAKGLSDYAKELERQRDDLLSALIEYANPLNWKMDDQDIRRIWTEPGSSAPDYYNGFELAMSAINKATGEQS